MSPTIIPAIAILIMVLLNPEPAPEKRVLVPAVQNEQQFAKVEKNEEGTNTLIKPVYRESDNPLTRKILLSFIKKYKRSEEEAEAITNSLLKSGKQQNVDPLFTAALISRESSFNKKAISTTGAKGLGQIKDFNYKSLKIKNPFDIDENVSGTTSYIKQMMEHWKGELDDTRLALASYYKGAGAVKRDKKKLDHRTNSYVDDILTRYKQLFELRNKYRKEEKDES